MSDKLTAEIAGLRRDIQNQTQGLKQLADTIAMQQDELRMIRDLLSQKPEKSNLEDLINQLLHTMDGQTDAIERVGRAMDNVGPNIEQAVVRGFNRVAPLV